MIKQIFLCGLLLLGLASPVAAADYWLLTDVGSSARMVGFGGVEGFSDSADAIFNNPAGLYRTKGRSTASFFKTNIIDEVDYFNFAFASDTKWGRFGVGYMEALVGDIPHTAEDDNGRFFAQYNFDYKNTLVKGAYQNSLSDDLHLGVSLTQYTNSFDGIVGRGYNLDVGGIYVHDWAEISLGFRNAVLNRDVKYNNGRSERLPSQLTLSSKITAIPRTDLLFQAKRVPGHFLMSTGVVYKPKMLRFFQVSAGSRQFQSLNTVKGTYSVGLILRLRGVQFHYAYEKSDHFEYDNKNYFSMNFSF